ncbi:hypothetical protein SBRY_10319 [Actinacidiphila bryophytorum]|uniref:Uncharacterized protein n=1 Tax=Actinacidiphila bryophytorum TaxID=1436133 RepID=A0A9W4GYK1_9ACTN|nr:hypothetical protein SBRY_10319 [Actinacidiphila bryophytorum]
MAQRQHGGRPADRLRRHRRPRRQHPGLLHRRLLGPARRHHRLPHGPVADQQRQERLHAALLAGHPPLGLPVDLAAVRRGELAGRQRHHRRGARRVDACRGHLRQARQRRHPLRQRCAAGRPGRTADRREGDRERRAAADRPLQRPQQGGVHRVLEGPDRRGRGLAARPDPGRDRAGRPAAGRRRQARRRERRPVAAGPRRGQHHRPGRHRQRLRPHADFLQRRHARRRRHRAGRRQRRGGDTGTDGGRDRVLHRHQPGADRPGRHPGQARRVRRAGRGAALGRRLRLGAVVPDHRPHHDPRRRPEPGDRTDQPLAVRPAQRGRHLQRRRLRGPGRRRHRRRLQRRGRGPRHRRLRRAGRHRLALHGRRPRGHPAVHRGRRRRPLLGRRRLRGRCLEPLPARPRAGPQGLVGRDERPGPAGPGHRRLKEGPPPAPPIPRPAPTPLVPAAVRSACLPRGLFQGGVQL